MARVVIAYKFLRAGAVAPFTRFTWPVGDWVDAEQNVHLCRAGIHACRIADLPLWLAPELWEIELEGEILEQGRKLVASRGRLMRRIEEWNEAARDDFGRFCVGRTRHRLGYVPVLSGYVADVERMVGDGRVPLAAFAAARAAEQRDGHPGYERERAAQAAWLVERIGLVRPERR